MDSPDAPATSSRPPEGMEPSALAPAAEGSRPRFPLLSGTNGRLFLVLLVIGLVVRFVPAYIFYGSNDVGAWRLTIRDFRQGINPYITGKLNWPPLWPALLLYTGRMQEVYNVPDYLSVKVVPILADVAIGLALYFWFLNEWKDARRAFRRALWYILNPVAIGNCAMHGQFDSLPVLFTVLAVMTATRAGSRMSPAGGVWLSLGILAKTWPIIFLPLFIRDIKSVPGRLVFVLVAVLPTVISVAWLYRQDPESIKKNVLSYRGGNSIYGLTIPRYFLNRQADAEDAAKARLSAQHSTTPPTRASRRQLVPRDEETAAPDETEDKNAVGARRTGFQLAAAVRLLMYAVWIATYILLWRRGTLIIGVCLLLLDFFVFSSAVGIQYFVWMVGPSILGDFKRMRLYTVLASLMLGITYAFSPFDGEHFMFLARKRTLQFYLHNLDAHHQLISMLLGIPVWLYCVWWWYTLWRETLAGATAPPQEEDITAVAA